MTGYFKYRLISTFAYRDRPSQILLLKRTLSNINELRAFEREFGDDPVLSSFVPPITYLMELSRTVEDALFMIEAGTNIFGKPLRHGQIVRLNWDVQMLVHQVRGAEMGQLAFKRRIGG